ncbi:MAG: hypothetical protein J5648_05535 [Lachnospiraceae bacterium]|nr:hypothetical protein [Lachnospiraceae bacterium]
MSYPRRKLDMDLLILEKASCDRMTAVQKEKDPTWDFNRFEALHYGSLDGPIEPKYDSYTVLSDAEEELNKLDAERPFLLPLERGTHYVWELFSELPRVGSSKSTRQFWNRLSRAMSDLPLPMEEDAFIDAFTQASLPLLSGATDMGDRFYLSELDYGGWSGGIVSKDFLIDGLEMLVKKLSGPLCERYGGKKKRKDILEDDLEEYAEETAEESSEESAGEDSEKSPEENSEENPEAGSQEDSQQDPEDGEFKQKEDIKEDVSEQKDRTDL